jgi:hypothetical protein
MATKSSGSSQLAPWQNLESGFFSFNGMNFRKDHTGKWIPYSTQSTNTVGGVNQAQSDMANAYANILNQGGPEALMQMGGGVGGMSGRDVLNYSQNRMNEEDFARRDDEADLTALEKEFSDVPGQLKTMYADRARAAGTYADTNEFQRGLSSDVQAGARGAQALLSGRINALRSKLGKEPLAGTAAAGPTAVTDNPANLTGDKAAANADMGAAAGGAVSSSGPDSDSVGSGTPQHLDTTNNAVTSLQSRTTALKKKTNQY